MIEQVIANFSATWCGPCRMIAPFFSELSEKYPSLMFLLVDVDELVVSNILFFWTLKKPDLEILTIDLGMPLLMPMDYTHKS